MFRIQPVRLEYHKQIIGLIQGEFTDYRADKGDLDKIWQRFAAQTNVIALMAVQDSQVIGYANAVIEQKIHGDPVAHMESLVVHRDHRHQGVGRELILQLVAAARQAGCCKSVCITQAHNVDFWYKCGFEACQIGMHQRHD